jgi:formate dehydrogenase alpha subunit
VTHAIDNETLTLTIDGREVSARRDATVLETCREAGIHIPTLCHDPRLEPYGACRMCIVEIAGMRGFPTSCTTKVADGMVVTTDSDTLRELRTGVVELLLCVLYV